MTDTGARLWHPWLRINRVLRAMLHTRWSAEAWPQIKAEFKKALALPLAALVLAGCASESHYAVYKHSITGDVLECEKEPAGGGIGIYGVGDLPKIDKYNDCKDALEALGYERAGTVDRKPTATSTSDLATPRRPPVE